MKNVRQMLLAIILVIGLFVPYGLSVAGSQNPSLFIINAPKVEIVPVKGGYTVKLVGMTDKIHYFTDKPKRLAGSTNIQEFMAMWQDNHLDNANQQPNAALVTYAGTAHPAEVYTFEIQSPTFDAKTKTLQFKATLLNPEASLTPITLKQASLFIDDIQWNGNKFKHG